MKIEFLPEPELEFGTGRHIDIRFGLMHHGPLDRLKQTAPKQIRIGIIGTAESLEGVQTWLNRCRNGVAAKNSNQPNLFPRFPGFGGNTNLPADIIIDSQLQRAIRQQEIDKLITSFKSSKLVEDAVQIFLNEIQTLSEKSTADVFVSAVPMDLLNAMRGEDISEGEAGRQQNPKADFHHLLKAKAMNLRKPIQIILPMTYDDTKRLRQKRKKENVKNLQDEATRAWNIYTALYYKTGGIPWRLVQDPSAFTVCYIGVSFYKTLNESKMMTSTAQVFNERGEGVILRGGAAIISKEDRQPRLQKSDACKLLMDALKAYKGEHHNLPARIVLVKTSTFNADELEGFREALDAYHIESIDFVSVRDSFTRLFRYGEYPTLRGTLLNLDDRCHVLYTRGAVDFYRTYPGMYIPRPFGFRCEETEQTPRFLGQEILGLTKMNWNNTQFDNDDPIIIKAARNVGNILKYLTEDDSIERRYSFYM